MMRIRRLEDVTRERMKRRTEIQIRIRERGEKRDYDERQMGMSET